MSIPPKPPASPPVDQLEAPLAADQSGDSPTGVSVILSVLNEELHLRETLAAVLSQDWVGELQIVIALGPSVDQTDEIAREIARDNPLVELVQNPSGRTPDGLNAALAAVKYPVVVRADGHCVLPANYISLAVATLEQTGADNVGGVMAAVGQTDFECAVACAMTSRIGVGGAAFHTGGKPGPALTVYLGSFKKSTLDAVGGYDGSFLRAQDWEMNHRILNAGGTVWFNPEMQVTYRPRPNLKALTKQYFNYGRWRREIMRTYGQTVSLRYLAPPLLVTGLALTLIAAIVLAVTGQWTWSLVALVPTLGYLAGAIIGGVAISGGTSGKTRLLTPLALMAMHIAWGVGFICSPSGLRKSEPASGNPESPRAEEQSNA